jgi:hypothetical protein
MRQVAVVVLASLFAVSAAVAQTGGKTSTTRSTKSTKAKPPSTTSRLDQLQGALDAQQQQINQLRQELQTKDQSIQQLQQQVTQAQNAAMQSQQKADAASAAAAAISQQDLATVKTDVADLKSNMTNTTLALQETQKSVTSLESPLAIHYKGVTITPGGFLAAETVWRQRSMGADINTNFNAVPFPGSTQANTSEFFGSGRQSRISMLVEGKLKTTKLTGYVEADFLSAAVTSNDNQSNSYSLRQRQVWGQAALHGWNFTGGQMWSLVTETKKGLDNRTEALPMTIDPQYTLGFSWARQWGFRVTKNFANKFWAGFSVENPEVNSIGGSGFSTISVTTPTGCTVGTVVNNAQGVPVVCTATTSTNFVVGSLGNSGGLYNSLANYSSNYAPDFIAKIAVEPGFGHYELYGVLAQFRDRIYPCGVNSLTTMCGGKLGPSGADASNQNYTGGGVGANARVTIAKHFDIGGHFLGGNGIERYGTGGLPDVTVRPDGTLVPLRGLQGLGTLEFHNAKMDLYFNYGTEYAQRTFYTNHFVTPASTIGYGRPGSVTAACVEPQPTVPANQPPITSTTGWNPSSSCKGDTRYLSEGTVGFWYRLYNGPKGRLQFGPQYSYILRTTWSNLKSPNGEPKATENMFLTSFRYYLP